MQRFFSAERKLQLDLDTSQLLPFEGADVKWQKMVKAKDQAEAQAKAAIIYVAVMIKLGFVIATLNGLRTLNAIEGLHAPSPHPTAHQGEMPEGDAGYPWYDGN